MTGFIDLNAYDGADVEADICIAGAGAAGIAMARELIKRSNMRVVLLESGGHELDGRTQFLYQAENTGVQYFDLTVSRLRYFGGTTNHWGGYTNANSRRDFDGDAAMGLPPWPIDFDEYQSYILRATQMLELNAANYEAENHATYTGNDTSILIDKRSDDLKTVSFLRTERRRFGEVFGEELSAADNLQIFLNANVTHVQLADNGVSVDHFVVKTLDGKTIRVRAKEYALACHAVENARLLLLSDDVVNTGIGNASDQVGRNFMEHIHLTSGELIADTANIPKFYYRDRRHDPIPRMRSVVTSVSDEARRRERMSSYYVRFAAEYDDEVVYNSMRYLRRSFFKPFEARMVTAVGDVVVDLSNASRLIQEEAGLRPHQIGRFRMNHRIDQAPNPDSRITLTNDRDVLGLRKIKLHWDFTDLDLHTFNKGQDIAVRELSALGFGRFATEPFTMDYLRENVLGHYHHMGTTRMSTAASQGVVDGDSRVHGVSNLYVTGSSTFPTSGRSGPTLTVIALAMRLADHMAGKVAA